MIVSEERPLAAGCEGAPFQRATTETSSGGDPMPNTNSTVFNGSTINLSNFDLGEGPVFVDLDINSAGALTPNNAPSQDGVLRIGEEGTALSDVENIIGTDLV